MRWLLDGGHGWPHDDLPTWLIRHDASLVTQIGVTRAPLHRIEGGLELTARSCRAGDSCSSTVAIGVVDAVRLQWVRSR